MTKKRYFAVAGLVAILVCAGFAVAMMLPDAPGPGVTKANFDRIETKMTIEEVEAILGRATYPKFNLAGILPDKAEYGRADLWRRDDGVFIVVTFKDGGVIGRDWRDPNETIIKKLRRWLRL